MSCSYKKQNGFITRTFYLHKIYIIFHFKLRMTRGVYWFNIDVHFVLGCFVAFVRDFGLKIYSDP